MGLTIANECTSLDCTYFSFYKLRKAIAYALGKDVGDLYSELENPCITGRDADAYDRKVEKMADKYGESYYPVFDFLYASDCDGEVKAENIVMIRDLAEKVDRDFVIGYAAHANCAKFSDFKKLLDECCEKHLSVNWY